MLEVVSAPRHVAAFHFVDTVTAKDYAAIESEVESKLAAHPRIGVYADLTGFRAITPAALLRDLRYSFSKFADWDRFPRAAIVSDSRAVRTAIELVDRIVPQVEVQTFPAERRDEALAWAADLREAASRPAALRFIDTTRADTYALVWSGKLTRADMKRVVEVLGPAFESHPSVRLLVRIEKLGGVEPLAFFQSGLASLKLLGGRKLERYALVGGPSWLPRYVSVLARVTRLDIRSFDNEQAAYRWLEAEPRVAVLRAEAE